MTTWRKMGRTAVRVLFLYTGAVAFLHGSPASADWVTINPAPDQVILLINYSGIPAVTFDVTAAQMGNGTPIAAATIGGILTPLEFEMSVQRKGNSPVTATMKANAPAMLGGLIPITDISWTSAAAAFTPVGATLIPNDYFHGGSQDIVSVTATGGGNFYAGGALTFYFKNDTVYPQGTYGPVTVSYTASIGP